jgi:hypothetical protein
MSNLSDNKPNGSSFISIGGAIVFAVIAFFAYEVWTKSRIDDCINVAYSTYTDQWTFTCKTLGKDAKKRDKGKLCSLPRLVAQQLDDSLQKDKNFCVSYG